MKLILGTFAILAASSAVAQSKIPDSIQKSDMLQLVDITEMPIPVPQAELEKAQHNTLQKADDGISAIENSPETVRRFFSNVDMVREQISSPANQMSLENNGHQAPVVFKALSELKLGFTAARLNRGDLIGITVRGTVVDNAWTGVERYYRIPGTGTFRLTETNLKATGGMFYMLKKNVNTSVAGKPAISKVISDGDGQTLEEILWVNGPMLYMLTFAPDTTTGRFGKTKSNSRVSAISLAQEVR